MDSLPPDTIIIEAEYLARVNWSLLRTGIPLVLRLSARGHSARPAPAVLTLSLVPDRPLLLTDIEVQISAEDLRRGEELSGRTYEPLRANWLWLNAWQVGEQPVSAALRLRLGRAVIDCPVEVLPPTHWHRVVNKNEARGGRLETRRVIARVSQAGVKTEVFEGFVEWNDELPYPPLESAVAALIDPNDPYARPDGPQGNLGNEVERNLRVDVGEAQRAAMPNVSPEQLLKAFYVSVLHKQSLRHLDYHAVYEPDVQAVRLLKDDRERGALCLDLACAGCEVLEARGERPVFILTADGRHAALGLLAPSFDGFAGGLPVSASASEIERLVERGSLKLLDVTRALGNVSYAEALRASVWRVIGDGFVHAVDIRAVRKFEVGGRRFFVNPLPRPRRNPADWITVYLHRLLEELRPAPSTPTPQEHAEPSLGDPTGLFIPLACETRPGEARPVLDAGQRRGLLEESIIERPGKLALLADAGSGKSYVCQRVAVELAQKFLERVGSDNFSEHGDSHSPVPVFFRLSELGRNQTNILSVIADFVRECPGPDGLADAAARYRLLFILDALDESDFRRRYLDPKEYVELFSSLCALPQVSILLTSRPAMFPGDPGVYLPQFEVAHLLGWGAEDFREYLLACERVKGIDFQGGWQRFYELIFDAEENSNLRDLIKTPLFARMIVETRKEIEGRAAVCGEGRTRIANELDLYRLYTRQCLARRKEEIEVEEAHAATSEVALLMYMRRHDALPLETIAQSLAFYIQQNGISVWRQILAGDFVVHGLLVPAAGPLPKDGPVFRFSHLSIQHYFLAERLAAELRQARARTTDGGSDGFPFIVGCAPFEEGVVAFLSQMIGARAGDGGEAGPAEIDMEWIGAKLNVDKDERVYLLSKSISSRVEGFEARPSLALRNMVLVYVRAGGRVEGADLSELELSGVNLSNAQLTRTDFTLSKLSGSVLTNADLSHSLFRRADLGEADLTGASLVGADLDGCDLSFLRVRDLDSPPKLYGARNLDNIKLDRDDGKTLRLLLQCVAFYDDDPRAKSWVEATRAVLKKSSRAGG